MAASSEGADRRPAAGATAALCAVIDIGKTHLKLAVIDGRGEVLAERRQGNAPVHTATGAGYLALDTEATAAWLCDALAGLGPLRAALRRAIVTTHGAAFAALKGDRLALPVPDYEFDGFDPDRAGWQGQLDAFEATLCPTLPRGLNAATQLDWLSRHCCDAFDAADTLLPYAQYWAWWLCGVAACEVSSLGCHTQLWRPQERAFSQLARRRGWAARMPPMRPAWAVLGPVRAELVRRLGLPAGLQVHCGAHDSNACLARHLRAWPRMSLVSTGTWIVVMAPGADAAPLDGTPDLLANVSVRGDLVPTGRFMGGRELAALCAGADPALADEGTLAGLLGRGVAALPGFETQGGPFRRQAGCVLEGHRQLASTELTPPERATLAMLYCAEVTAWLLRRLQAAAPVIVEGPFAVSTVFMRVLAALVPAGSLHASTDALEGTARGAWMLTRWESASAQALDAEAIDAAPRLRTVAASALAPAIARHFGAWQSHADAAAAAAATSASVTPAY